MQVELIQPKQGWVEIDPDTLWKSIVKVMKNAIKNADIEPQNVKSIGISTQRATFINWRKSNGKHFHNFITWKDLRANELVKEWNQSLTMKGIRMGSKLLHFLTRHKKFVVGGIYRFKNKMVILRLLWTLQNVPELQNALKIDDVMYGTLDSWLLYKLSGEERLHMTNVSNAAATGIQNIPKYSIIFQNIP